MSNLGSLFTGEWQVLDDSGNPVSGALINSYAAGTVTPQNTYTTSALSVANANPIVADAAGRFIAFLDPTLAYKFIITTSAGVQVGDTIDNYYPGNPAPTLTTPTITGLLTLSGGQIAFPATQVPSTNANTLDDYEEGTWTPTITGSGGGSGQVYTSHNGTYVKIGKFVHVQGEIVLSTLGTVTNNALIAGLPFTAATAASANEAAISVGYFTVMTATFVFIAGFVISNTTTIGLYGLKAAATGVAPLVSGDLSNTTTIYFSANYIASA